jgi:hypothetical protein
MFTSPILADWLNGADDKRPDATHHILCQFRRMYGHLVFCLPAFHKGKKYQLSENTFLIPSLLETLFRTYTKKGTGDTVNGDQETGALFCYRYFVWRPEKEPGE